MGHDKYALKEIIFECNPNLERCKSVRDSGFLYCLKRPLYNRQDGKIEEETILFVRMEWRKMRNEGCGMMNRMKIVIPTMLVVGILALWILEKDHSEVPLQYRIPIALLGALISGVLTYFLFKNDADGVDKKSDK